MKFQLKIYAAALIFKQYFWHQLCHVETDCFKWLQCNFTLEMMILNDVKARGYYDAVTSPMNGDVNEKGI